MQDQQKGASFRWVGSSAVEFPLRACQIMKASFVCDPPVGACGYRPEVLASMALMASRLEQVLKAPVR